jgi:hypothetical protein
MELGEKRTVGFELLENYDDDFKIRSCHGQSLHHSFSALYRRAVEAGPCDDGLPQSVEFFQLFKGNF